MIRLLREARIVPRTYTPARSVSRSAPVSRTSSGGTASGTTSRPSGGTSGGSTSTTPKATKPKPAPTAGKSGKTPKGKAKGLRK